MKEYLANMKAFSGCGAAERDGAAGFFSVKKFSPGEVICEENCSPGELFIVYSGKIKSAYTQGGGIERKHNVFTAGDTFGEMSAFGNKPLFDTYTAVEHSEIISIDEAGFLKFIEESPECAYKVLTNLLSNTVAQLRKTSRFLADIAEWGENASRRVITDELTGLYNRAFMDDAVENFFNISVSNSKPLSLLMLDIDNFREINESNDSESCDRVIIEFAGIIRRLISRHGIMARYGGDEFSILLPETDIQKAMEIGGEIRGAVENFNFSKHFRGKSVPITTSIGISNFPETASTMDEFKQKADASLYRAKQTGKNRVEWE